MSVERVERFARLDCSHYRPKDQTSMAGQLEALIGIRAGFFQSGV
jgi:hypothetical protein